MPLPLTVSCFSKIQIGFIFLVLAHPGNPGQRAVKRVFVCCLYLVPCPSKNCEVLYKANDKDICTIMIICCSRVLATSFKDVIDFLCFERR